MKARHEKAAALLLAIVAATAPAACSGGSGAVTDAGPGGDAAADAGATGCDPFTQDCAAGSKCDFGCQGSTAALACRADNGSGALGAACSAALPCAKGAGCVATPDAGSVCWKYCAGDGDCLTGERCHNVSLAVACGGSSGPLLLHFCY